ncbi:MAG: putative glycolipid-binding domain-containing protein [Bacillota bacterium]|nr:putative glycolipid-binding domain-containing protein [Bacillota bacterium]
MPWEWQKEKGGGHRLHLFHDGEPVASFDVEIAEEWATIRHVAFHQPKEEAWREILSYWRGQGLKGLRLERREPHAPPFLTPSIDFTALPVVENAFLWQHRQGAHHLSLQGNGWSYRTQGMSLGQQNGRPYRADFSWEGQADWTLRRLTLTWGAQKVEVHHDGRGTWLAKDGRPLPGAGDARQLFLWLTPFSHTAALRFLQMRPELQGTFVALELIPVEAAAPLPADEGASFGQLLFRRVRHRYEPLGGGRYRWSREEAGTREILRVDEESWLLEGGGWVLLARERG